MKCALNKISIRLMKTLQEKTKQLIMNIKMLRIIKMKTQEMLTLMIHCMALNKDLETLTLTKSPAEL